MTLEHIQEIFHQLDSTSRGGSMKRILPQVGRDDKLCSSFVHEDFDAILLARASSEEQRGVPVVVAAIDDGTGAD